MEENTGCWWGVHNGVAGSRLQTGIPSILDPQLKTPKFRNIFQINCLLVFVKTNVFKNKTTPFFTLLCLRLGNWNCRRQRYCLVSHETVQTTGFLRRDDIFLIVGRARDELVIRKEEYQHITQLERPSKMKTCPVSLLSRFFSLHLSVAKGRHDAVVPLSAPNGFSWPILFQSTRM